MLTWRRKPRYLLPHVEVLEDRSLPAIFTVNVTHDLVNDLFDPADRSLREAIQVANANPGLDTIAFHVSGNGPHTIRPTAALPDITDPVIIDGTTQDGFAGTPLIELDGESAGEDANGLTILAGGSTVRGLVINRFAGSGIKITAGDGNLIEGNFIGTDVTGTRALGNFWGVVITQGHFNRIGTNGDGIADKTERNIISGNESFGVLIAGYLGDGDQEPLTTNTVVAGNFIGTDVTGTRPLGNRTGIGLMGARGTRIGTNGDGVGDAAERNLISANVVGVTTGSLIANRQVAQERVDPNVERPPRFNDPGLGSDRAIDSEDNVIAGNFIGTDVSGTVALGNGLGLYVRGRFSRIGTNKGTADADERNIISGNGEGLFIRGDRNVITGNIIGTDVSGSGPLPNGHYEDLPMCPGGHPGEPCTFVQTRSNVILDDYRAGFHETVYFTLYEFSLESDPAVVASTFKPLDGPAFLRGTGVTIAGSANVIGGEGSLGNTIAFNTGAGVAVRPAIPHPTIAVLEEAAPTPPTGNAIRGNSIYSNSALGIDLGGDGVTLNDSGDADGGTDNELQNYPVLWGVQRGSSTRVTGNLHSRANAAFTLDFYANREGDPSGFGEGQRHLGSAVVATGADGNVDFDVELAAAISAGEGVSATATDAAGNTSEFSFVPQGTVTARVSDRHLVIQGDGTNQALQIVPGSAGVGSYLVTDGQGTTAFFGATAGLQIELNAGADAAFLTGTAAPLPVSGGFQVRTGSGADAVWATRVVVQGPTELDTGPDDDRLVILETKCRADLSILTGSGQDLIDLDAIRVDGDVTIDTAAGDDEVTVHAALLRGDLGISCGDDDDKVRWEASQVKGRSQIDAGNGENEVTLRDSLFAGDLEVRTGTGRDELRLTGVTAQRDTLVTTGDGPDRMEVSDAHFQRDLGIWTGAGDDLVSFIPAGEFEEGTSATVHRNTVMQTGSGDDTIELESAVFKGDLTVRTGTGDDFFGLFGNFIEGPPTAIVRGRTDIDTGGGSDTVGFARTLLRGAVSIQTGSDDDEAGFFWAKVLGRVQMETSQGADMVGVANTTFQQRVLIKLGPDDDRLTVDGEDADPELPATIFASVFELRTGAGEDTIEISPAVVFRKRRR